MHCWNRASIQCYDRHGPRTEEIRAAEAQVRQMKAALDYAETQLGDTEIKAAISGRYCKGLSNAGEMVSPSAFGNPAPDNQWLPGGSYRPADRARYQPDRFRAVEVWATSGDRPRSLSQLEIHRRITEIAPEANRAKATSR